MIKKLFTNSAIYGIAPHVPKIVSVFILPLLTTRLTDVDYGIAGTIAAYTMALAAFQRLDLMWYYKFHSINQGVNIKYYGGKYMGFFKIGWYFLQSCRELFFIL